MNKRLPSLLSLALALLLVLGLRPATAQAAGVSFSGARSLRSGETVTVVCTVSGSGFLGLEGDLSYDSDQLDLLGTECLLGGGWQMDQNGGRLLLWDSTQTTPIDGVVPVFSATFRVKDGASPGGSVSAAVRNVVASGEDSESSLGGDSWSADILRPLSGNTRLAYLGCDDGDLTPAFDPDIKDYQITVPFSVEALSLSTEADHSRSTVSVSGNSLSVGPNTVTVTVTAENGSTRRYTITARREQDPNYVPNDDARLASLKPSHGRLSPKFDSKIREYVVYVPFEVTSIRISGTARDPEAQDVTGGSTTKLDVGDNLLKIKCTAEDEETFKVYKVHVWRMPLFAGTLPEIVPPKEEIPPEGETPSPAPEELQPGEKSPTAPLFELDSGTTALVAVLLLLCCGVAVLFWFLGRDSERRKALPDAVRSTVKHGAPLPVTTPVSCYEDENFPQPQPEDEEDEDTPLADSKLCGDYVKLERDHAPVGDGLADAAAPGEPVPWQTALEALEALEHLRFPSAKSRSTPQESQDVLQDTGDVSPAGDAAPSPEQPAEETAAPVAETVPVVKENPVVQPAAPEDLHIPEDLNDDEAVIAMAEALVHQILPGHIASPEDTAHRGMSVDDILRDIENM